MLNFIHLKIRIFFPHEKITTRTIRISGALIVKKSLWSGLENYANYISNWPQD
jgi:hypothetical protein